VETRNNVVLKTALSPAERASPANVRAAHNGKSGYEVSAPIPHRINEAQSDMRGVKEGWYVMDDEGKLTLGPFSTRADCLDCLRIAVRPTN
jgi:hypothetical protein